MCYHVQFNYNIQKLKVCIVKSSRNEVAGNIYAADARTKGSRKARSKVSNGGSIINQNVSDNFNSGINGEQFICQWSQKVRQ